MYVHNKVRQIDRDNNEDYNAKYYLKNQYLNWQTWDSNQALDPDSTAFQVTWLQNIKRLMNLFYYDEANYNLIDVGCGSGISTLYFAENSHFKTYSGFDFSAKLIDEAKQNHAIFKKRHDCHIDFFVANAKEFYPPKTSNLFFLFNPFGWLTLHAFIEKNLDDFKTHQSVLAYANDLHINELSQTYPEVKIVRDNYYNLSLIYF